jgi:hypothetical protein
LKFGGAKGEEEGGGEAKVVGMIDEVVTILGSEGGDLNGIALKIVDNALAEATRKVRGEIGVSGVGLREIGLEEVSEEGPSPRQTVPVGDMDERQGTMTTIPSSPFVGGGVELKIKASRLLFGGRSVVADGDIDVTIIK